MPALTHERLVELLDYDPASGVFVWKKITTNRVKVGDVVGSVHSAGYRTTRIDGEMFFLHRLAWFYIYGVWPSDQIDHINHDKSDNRIANLTSASNSTNGKNSSLSVSNSSGYTGVRKHRPSGKWQARIFVDGREKHLGLFNRVEDAVLARKCANRKFGFHDNHGTLFGAS